MDELEALAGHGLQAKINGKGLYGGNRPGFVEEKVAIANEILQKGEQFAKEGKTPLYFAMDQKMLGTDRSSRCVFKRRSGTGSTGITGSWCSVLQCLPEIMKKRQKAIGRLAGVDEVIAGVLA